MNTQFYFIILISLVCFMVVLNFILMGQISQLMKRKPKRTTEEVLSSEERDKLKAAASAQYEAAMVRELKRFEQSLTKASTELLSDLHAQVVKSDAEIAAAAAQLTTQTQAEYAQLMQSATGHLRTQLATLDTAITQATTTQTTAMAELVEGRKQAVITRVDTQLADILTQYLNATLEQLDLTDQEQFIIAKLEEIKPRLKEDLNHVK